MYILKWLPILKFLKCPILILYIKSKLQTNFEIWSKNAEKNHFCLETSKKLIGSTESPVSTPGFTWINSQLNFGPNLGLNGPNFGQKFFVQPKKPPLVVKYH